jgi:multidrug transporter EmrE-like cation transporter
MGIILRILPTVLLVAYSQVIVKWRVQVLGGLPTGHHSGLLKYVAYLLDPFILSAYLAGLIGSLVWLNALAKLPLAQAFPIYQGLTFLVVVASSAMLLDEPMNAPKLFGAALILAGVVVGAQG